MDLMPLLACLAPCLDATTLRRLACVVAALLAMTDRVTMLGLSRWTGKGGSYRTVQRFFNAAIPWDKARWLLVRRHLRQVPGAVLLAGDEVVTPKAGRNAHGLGRFFSSIYGKPVPGLCHLCLSLVPVNERVAHPMTMLPVKPPEKVPAAAPPSPPQKRGRPNRVRRIAREA
jgi:putative transposase